MDVAKIKRGTLTLVHRAPRCASTHNPGMWPYASRCVRGTGHPDDHIDKHGILWEGDDSE